MSRNYVIEDDDFTYYFEAEPIIENTSFDHEFGAEQSVHMTAVEINNAIIKDMKNKEYKRVDLDSEKINENIKERLFNEVLDDLQSGFFD